MQHLAASVLIALSLAGAPPIKLTVTVDVGSTTASLHHEKATLRCQGQHASGRGFLRRDAAKACRLVRRGTVERVPDAQKQPRFCSQIYGGPQVAHVTGRIGKHAIDLTVTRTNGCGIDDWQALHTLLGDPER